MERQLISADELRVLRQIHAKFPFPDEYLIIDVETTGLDTASALLLDFSAMRVKGGEVVDTSVYQFSWADTPYARRVQDDMLKVASQMASRGTKFAYTWEKLAKEGMPWNQALHRAVTDIYEAAAAGIPVVGHNVIRFDSGVLDSHVSRFIEGYQIPWPPVWDTAVIEKALQTDMWPWDGETMEEWQSRVLGARAYVKYNLWGHCFDKYELGNRLECDAEHVAVCDCELVHHMMNIWRESLNGQEEAGAGADTREVGHDQGPAGIPEGDSGTEE